MAARTRLPLGLLAAVALFGFGTAGYVTWRHERAQLLDTYTARTQAYLAGVLADFDTAVRGGASDVLLLARSPEAIGAASGDAGRTRDLEALFRAYAVTREEMLQVRLIDLDGNERIRFDRRHGEVVETSELQNKADRDYFVEASKLPEGQVYTSGFNLNIEHGRVERPPVPVVRFATGVFDETGRRRAIVVINRDAASLLASVIHARSGVPGELVLVDRDGFYLSHSDGAREWGGPTMLATGASLWKDHPEVARWCHEQQGADCTWRNEGTVAVRSPHGDPKVPVLLAIAPERAALAGRDFFPLLASLTAAALLAATALAWAWRQGRLWQLAAVPAPDGAPAPRSPKALLERLSTWEKRVISFTGRHGILALRVSLGVVFIWFGALKVLGVSPVADLVTKIIYIVPKGLALQFLGWTEILVGVGLFFRMALRPTMALFFVHLTGTFLVLFRHPDLAFQGNNPLLLSAIGEFVIKNVVLLAAGLVVLSTIHRRDEEVWPAAERPPRPVPVAQVGGRGVGG